MPRRKVVAKREILPDPKFKSVLLTRFMNVLMVDGKKSIAEKVLYGALDVLSEKISKQDIKITDSENNTLDITDTVKIFESIIDKVKPNVQVKSRRVGGATYQVPSEVKPVRGVALSMRWVVQAARGRNEKGMMLKLASELLDVVNDKGAALKKKDDTHKMAKANQAFAHLRWN